MTSLWRSQSLVGSEIQPFKQNSRELNYQKAFADAIITSTTRLNSQIKGQKGYDRNNDFMDKMSDAKRTYDEFMWDYKVRN